jgi:hypothetical protein
MRYSVLALVCALSGCRDKPPAKPPAGMRTRAPVGFVGKWVQLEPRTHLGDTLVLNADFTASGSVPWYDNRSRRATRWRIKFTSRDPVTARRDWYGRWDDGGDAACSFATGVDTTCISGPLVCIGDSLSVGCAAFRFTRDSLGLSTGARYVRATPPHTSAVVSGSRR